MSSHRILTSLYIALFATVILSNKYVLTILGFKFPMVFQGWQTLVGFIVFHLISISKRWTPVASIPRLDKAALTSLLPSFLLFTLTIVSGSKALSDIPVPYFLAINSLAPVVVYLFDHVIFPSADEELQTGDAGTKSTRGGYTMRLNKSSKQVANDGSSFQPVSRLKKRLGVHSGNVTCIIVVITSLAVIFLDLRQENDGMRSGSLFMGSHGNRADLNVSENNVLSSNHLHGNIAEVDQRNESLSNYKSSVNDKINVRLPLSPYTWMLAHVGCQVLSTLHGRLADARFNSADRLYYSLIFSLIVLAPASVYLEEAFAVLHYHEITQVKFITVSVVSAILGVTLHLFTFRMRNLVRFSSLASNLTQGGRERVNPTQTACPSRVHFSTAVYMASLITSLFSIAIQIDANRLELVATLMALLNVTALLCASQDIPSHLEPDSDKIEANFTVEGGLSSNDVERQVNCDSDSQKRYAFKRDLLIAAEDEDDDSAEGDAIDGGSGTTARTPLL